MKFPKELTTRTPLSKILAIFLFLTFPMLGFYLGIQYQRILTDYITPQLSFKNTQQTRESLDPRSNTNTSCHSDDDCSLFDTNFSSSILFCCRQQCDNLYNDTVVATSKQWLSQRSKLLCTPPLTCPQQPGFACTRPVVESVSHVKAICLLGTCRKIRN